MPQIITCGPFTLASTVSEMNVFRKPSDLIGNNYSPQAKHLDLRNITFLGSSNPEHKSIHNLNINILSFFCMF